MSIDQPMPTPPLVVGKPPVATFSLRETTELMIRHLGLHEGIYDLLIEFNIGVGQFGPTPEQVLPGAMVGISRIGIVESPAPGINSVNASICNPAPKKRARKKVD